MTEHSVPAAELSSFLSSIFSVPIDAALVEELSSSIKPIYLEAGGTLIQEGNPGDSMYAVVGGRVRAFVGLPDGSEIPIGEIGAGATVGEMSLITEDPRSATVRAIRDTELVEITRRGFEQLVAKRPEAILDLIRVIVDRAVKLMHDGREEPPIRTLALVAIDDRVALSEVAQRLIRSLEKFGHVLLLDRDRFDEEFGPGSADRIAATGSKNREIVAWLGAQETDHRFVVYQADRDATPWTARCLRQADRTVLVAGGSGTADSARTDEMLRNASATGPLVAQELVVVHENRAVKPSDTGRRLGNLDVVRHTHVSLDDPGQFDRLGRLLAGRAVGLVLGGGGARGFAHIGVLRALEEAGIPIDAIGGVSMGAIIAAQYAMGLGHDAIIDENRVGIAENKLSRDITLPLISLSSGNRFERALRSFFGDTQIEDLWLGYMCVSSNLSTADTYVHRLGLLWRAVKASNAAPGILPPVQQGGDLLVDGGILNNEPGDIMKRFNGGPVIVVNVGANQDFRVDPSHEVPTPWAVLGHRLSPFHQPIPHPDIASMITRSMMVGSRHKSMEIENATDYYLRPPVHEYRTDDYSKIDEIAEVGYRYAKEQVASWTELRPG